MFTAGVENCGWFQALNISQWNASVCRSVMRVSLKTCKSKLFMPGPTSTFRPELPTRSDAPPASGHGECATS